jgi:acyl dehydratase
MSAPGTGPSAPGFGAIEIGDELPAITAPITRLDLIRYCGASGDFNTIHWNERFAVSVGLPDVIAHGMLTMGITSRAVTDWLEDPGAIAEYSVRFTRPVVVPDPDGTVLTVNGKVSGKEPDDAGGGLVTLSLTATVNGQTVLARVRITARVRPS